MAHLCPQTQHAEPSVPRPARTCKQECEPHALGQQHEAPWCPLLPKQRIAAAGKEYRRPSFAVLVPSSAGSATPLQLYWAAGSPCECASRAASARTRAAWQRGRPLHAEPPAGHWPHLTLAAGAPARPRAPRAAPAAAWAAWAARRARRPFARACPAARRSASGTRTGTSTTEPAPHAARRQRGM
jgi:hypothetical protein